MFSNKNGQIDTDKLVLFAVLNSPGDNDVKSDALFTVFQEGGLEKQTHLTADDKDLEPAIENLIKMSTIGVTQLMQEVDGEHPMDLEDKADEISYTLEDLLNDNYLDPLFGHASRKSYEEWVSESGRNRNISGIWYEAN